MDIHEALYTTRMMRRIRGSGNYLADRRHSARLRKGRSTCR